MALEACVGPLPKEASYAEEIRDAEVVRSAYHHVSVLDGVAHAYNDGSYVLYLVYWRKRMGKTFTTPVQGIRLLTSLKMA